MFGVPIKKIILYFLLSLCLIFLSTISRSLRKDNGWFADYWFDYGLFGVNYGYMILFLLIVFFTLVLLNDKLHNQKILANRSFIRNTETGFKNLVYPVLGYGGFGFTPSALNSYNEYLRVVDENGQWGVVYVVDLSLSYYEVVKISYGNNYYYDLKSLGYISFEDLKKKLSKRYRVGLLTYGTIRSRGIEDMLHKCYSFNDMIRLF